ncbi:MAG: hypothetical protein JW745_06585 [Sedimentisphaerales bacterium]|nr:hypothetical protein [Sedimentisphaerales bacterium]
MKLTAVLNGQANGVSDNDSPVRRKHRRAGEYCRGYWGDWAGLVWGVGGVW